VNFGEILENWESEKLNNNKKKIENRKIHNNITMDTILNSYAPDSDVLISKEDKVPYIPNINREKMRRKKADLVLDLHGVSVEDAKIELNNFIHRSYRTGAKKILIIHGKGNHTNGQSVLKPLVKSILEMSPYIGDTGTPERRDGGSGATWAVIRQRSL
jgi:DNA-nicking Smr family endonuclease